MVFPAAAVHDSGMRLPDCENYCLCLSEAAVTAAADLPCHRCPLYQQDDSLMLYHTEIDGILRLLLAVTDERA